MVQDVLHIYHKLSPGEEIIHIRPVQASDAEAYLALMRQLDQETTFIKPRRKTPGFSHGDRRRVPFVGG